MKTAATVCEAPQAVLLARAADYLELTRPRMMLLVLFTVATGALLAAGGAPTWPVLLQTTIRSPTPRTAGPPARRRWRGIITRAGLAVSRSQRARNGK